MNSLDLNDIKNSDNPYSMKIMKFLGLFNNPGNNINNEFQNEMNLPLSLNNFKQNKDMPSNFIHFGNNNGININYDENFYKNNKYNNKKNIYNK